jgi:hypothetical protein
MCPWVGIDNDDKYMQLVVVVEQLYICSRRQRRRRAEAPSTTPIEAKLTPGLQRSA